MTLTENYSCLNAVDGCDETPDQVEVNHTVSILKSISTAMRMLAKVIFLLLFVAFQIPCTATAQNSAFTYQGRLTDGGGVANGRYDFIFQIFDAPVAGNSLGGALAVPDVPVKEGLFTVALDFGATPFTGPARWLQIGVGTNAAGTYSTLTPRQPLNSVPHAVYAGTAATVPNGAIGSAQLASGAITTSQLAPNAVDRSRIAGGQVVKSLNSLRDDITLVPGANVTLNTVGNSLVISTVTGDPSGAGFARLNVQNSAATAAGIPTVVFGFLVNATVSRGGFGYLTPPNVTVIDSNGFGAIITASISNGVVAGLAVQNAGYGYSEGTTISIEAPPNNAFQVFTGANIFSGATTLTNPNNLVVGTFAGNGAGLTGVIASASGLAWQVVSSTNLQAQPNTGYLLTNEAPVTVTLPVSPRPGDVLRIASSGAGGWRIAQNSGQFVSAKTLPNNLGAVWTPREGSRNWYCVASSADGSKLAAGVFDGQIYTSTNSGVSWIARDVSRKWASIASSADGTKLVAGVFLGQLYTSTDSGVTWLPRESNREWTAVASSADGAKLVAGFQGGGQLHTSTNSGLSWTPRGPAMNWRSVASSADGTKLVAVANGGQIHTSTDAGLTWVPRDANRAWGAVASSADGRKLVAVAQADYIYTSTDSGLSWTPREANRSWTAVATSGDGSRLIAGVNGLQIYVSMDSGVTWTPRESNRFWNAVVSSSDGSKLVAVDYGGQIYTSSGSSNSGASGYLLAEPNAAIELQYVGNGQFIPLSHEGVVVAY